MIWINNTSTCYESLKIDKDKPKSYYDEKHIIQKVRG